MINEKKKGASKDACYSKVKSRYSVWPSAYASGALVKCRKVGAANWGNSKKKNESLHTAYKNFIMEVMIGPDGKGLSPQDVAAAKERVKNKKASGGAPSPSPSPTTKERQEQQGPSLLSRASKGVKKFMADRKVAREKAAIQKGEAERRNAEQKKYLAGKKAEGSFEKARQKKIKAIGANRKKIEARKAAEKTAKLQRGIEREKAKEAAEIQNQSQRGTKQTIVGRGIDRAKDDLVSATYSAATGRGIGRGRAAARAGRERIQFQHTEYQRIGSILAEASAAWTRKEGKNPSGGLNAKGVASYRAKNPGSKLKTAVTTKPSKLKKGSKAASRRKSFCARMSGMRKRQKSSNNTGKDRLSLSLKKWNC